MVQDGVEMSTYGICTGACVALEPFRPSDGDTSRRDVDGIVGLERGDDPADIAATYAQQISKPLLSYRHIEVVSSVMGRQQPSCSALLD